MLCNFLVWTPQYHFVLFKKFEKTTHKSCSELLFFSPIAAQTAQTEEFMFKNVAYRPTVYRTGWHRPDNDMSMYFRHQISKITMIKESSFNNNPLFLNICLISLRPTLAFSAA